jgi:vacuolar-type H+-ATPase subunit D/Vma8
MKKYTVSVMNNDGYIECDYHVDENGNWVDFKDLFKLKSYIVYNQVTKKNEVLIVSDTNELNLVNKYCPHLDFDTEQQSLELSIEPYKQVLQVLIEKEKLEKQIMKLNSEIEKLTGEKPL